MTFESYVRSETIRKIAKSDIYNLVTRTNSMVKYGESRIYKDYDSGNYYIYDDNENIKYIDDDYIRSNFNVELLIDVTLHGYGIFKLSHDIYKILYEKRKEQEQ